MYVTDLTTSVAISGKNFPLLGEFKPHLDIGEKLLIFLWNLGKYWFSAPFNLKQQEHLSIYRVRKTIEQSWCEGDYLNHISIGHKLGKCQINQSSPNSSIRLFVRKTLYLTWIESSRKFMGGRNIIFSALDCSSDSKRIFFCSPDWSKTLNWLIMIWLSRLFQ